MPKLPKNQFVAVWLRMLAIKEIRMARDNHKLLKKQGREAALAYKLGGHADAESTLTLSSANDWMRILIANYTVTIRDFSSFAYEQLQGKSAKTQFTDLTTRFISRQGVSKAKGLTATTKEILTDVIRKGERDGLGVEAIAKNITESIGGSSISRGRAAIIARTETHMAASYAMHAQASDIGYAVNKTWVTVQDDRTRETHAAVDGTTIPNDDYFDVGDDRLLFPGDPDGSPEEIINCRCVLITEPAGNIFSEEN